MGQTLLSNMIPPILILAVTPIPIIVFLSGAELNPTAVDYTLRNIRIPIKRILTVAVIRIVIIISICEIES
jgi:hypothetical protein